MPLIEHPGRRIGKPNGSYVVDLADLRKTIVLCEACVSKFDPKRHNYFRERTLAVQGKCDSCRQFSQRATLHVHESLLKQVWAPLY